MANCTPIRPSNDPRTAAIPFAQRLRLKQTRGAGRNQMTSADMAMPVRNHQNRSSASRLTGLHHRRRRMAMTSAIEPDRSARASPGRGEMSVFCRASMSDSISSSDSWETAFGSRGGRSSRLAIRSPGMDIPNRSMIRTPAKEGQQNAGHVDAGHGDLPVTLGNISSPVMPINMPTRR